jgi:hypothetical protein
MTLTTHLVTFTLLAPPKCHQIRQIHQIRGIRQEHAR